MVITMGAREVEFRILGPFEVVVDGRAVRLSGQRARAVLAMLVVHHGQMFTIERLAAIWGADPPATVRNQVMIAMATVRRALREAGVEPQLIETMGSGYRLRGGLTDAQRAEQDIERARQAAREGRPAEASDLLSRALAWWRGPVLADLELPEAEASVSRWEELRLVALEERAELELTLGRHRDLTGELAALLAEQPLRERLRGMLMLALYRSGRRSDALEIYRTGRILLAEELGLDPGPELRRLEAAILADDPGLDIPPQQQARHTPAPAELPPDVMGFVGRERDLAALRRYAVPDSSTMAVVTAVTGAAGVGKTALALRFGHRTADEFPDGQLYIDLRGHSLRPPMAPLEALTRMLGSLGVPAEQIPGDEERAAGLYRSHLSGRRILVLLDNAHTADQVRPLLPGAPGCLTLVTSRDALAGLAASHGARRLSLGMLGHAESLRLLESVIGAERLAAERRTAEEIVRLCAHLPLALRVAAATLATHPHWSLAGYGTALAAGRLDMLQIDGDMAVRAAFSLSYARLPPPARRLFRLLGLVPGPDVTAPAAAALAGIDVTQAERLLDRLAAAHLLTEHQPHRHTFHDLLRQYAGELARQEDDSESRHEAAERLGAWYLARAAWAAEIAYPSITRLPALEAVVRQPAVQAPDEHAGRSPDGRGAAADWLRDERANLIAIAVHAAEHGPRHHAWLIADALRGHLFQHIDIADCVAVAEAALRAATAEGEPSGLATAQLCVGAAAQLRSDYGQARAAYAAAARYSEQAGWPQGVSAAHNNAASACHDQGELQPAVDHLDVALRINRDIGNVYGETNALSNLGTMHLELGALGEAERYLRHAVALHRTLRGSPLSSSLNELATVRRLLGHLDEALALATEALAHDRASGLPVPEVKSLATLAEIHRDAGRLGPALDHAIAAHDLAESTHHVYALCTAANVLGTVRTLGERYGEAADAHQRALELATEAGMRYMRVRALLGLARAHLGTGRRDLALSLADEALELARPTNYRLQEGAALAVVAEIGRAWEQRSARPS
ncbi:AfsR/SARP family transcriptional regulator [Streptosporangium roseum]|uniref:Transcriptional regulator, SARP family n=1 Tax=Streptosporangium roseum (strain ATCC 12428 / DSM 43021 / JCM 3005 / KCTC 9067 / NCIMB 10171 / NRRL 2505 / NI 9100) TaxID=479432 RepID=D2AS59_STRRD|nr:BTAD domain-containing putative transcriptional regulator [Streptosporangium roseum]ACZ86586.1 transcriptional regulator, SARP family [Streptosporangium roseum DSM 43021]